MAIIFKLTDAGRTALVNAQSTGSAARTLVSVGLTATAFAPTVNLSAVPGEIKRLTTIAGDVVADGTIHVTIRDDGPDAYTVRGFGLWLDNGVLLGTYSQQTPIVEKSGVSIMMMSTDLRVLDGSADVSTLQFGDTNFIDPPATTERQGVVELATLDEVADGIDDIRVVTPYALAQRLKLKASLLGARFMGAVTAPSFSGNGAQLTELAWKNIGGRPTTLDGYGITDAMRGNALDDKSLQAEGWQLLPGGLLMQWGTGTLPASGQNTSTVIVSFPKRFPVGPFGVFAVALEGANNVEGGVPSMLSQKLTPASAEIAGDCLAYTTFNKTCTVKWFAIGR